MFRFRVPLAITAVLALASGCSFGGSDSATELATGGEYSVAAALAEIPAELDAPQVTVVTADVLAATEASGLERPADAEDLPQWAMTLSGVPSRDGTMPAVFVPWASALHLDRAAQFEEIRDELGWSLLEVDAFVELTSPPETFLVIAGDVSLNSELPEVSDGVVTAGAGDDLSSDPAELTPARPLGVPLRMAQSGDRIVATPVTHHATAWLAGSSETFADHESLAPVAEALDDAEVFSAFVMSGHSMQFGTDQLTEAQRAQMIERVGDAIPEDPFSAVGVGWNVEDDRSVVTIAYLFASADAAERALPAFERTSEAISVVSAQPMESLMTLHSVVADDSMVVITASPAEGQSPATFYHQLVQRDLPFVHQ